MHSRKWNLRKSPSCPYFWKVMLKLGCSSLLLIKISVIFLQMLLRWVCDRYSGIYKIALGLDNKQHPFKIGGRCQFSHRPWNFILSCQVWIELCAFALAMSSSVEKCDPASPWPSGHGHTAACWEIPPCFAGMNLPLCHPESRTWPVCLSWEESISKSLVGLKEINKILLK